MVDVPEHLHLLLELPLPGGHVLEPLHHHRRAFLQHRLVACAHAPFPQHLRRRPQQVLQVETVTPARKKHQLSSFDDDVPASPAAPPPAAAAAAATGFWDLGASVRPLFLLLTTMKAMASRRRSARRPPATDIPAMAPAESLRPPPPAGAVPAGGPRDGDGVGEGKKGRVQGGRGPPQTEAEDSELAESTQRVGRNLADEPHPGEPEGEDGGVGGVARYAHPLAGGDGLVPTEAALVRDMREEREKRLPVPTQIRVDSLVTQ
ncbi:prokaryotic ubiquitin-like protein Pup [Striga asiatica]|uniref:Prokaryotic ubiquitin-like protein Pup n=1 Tax=Striga asiatica TaxID=4170 RepID=A0A5A7P5F8_STRAF|nr:prokaryotic ubiquitin-like protein Pup [Striga asiatica]